MRRRLAESAVGVAPSACSWRHRFRAVVIVTPVVAAARASGIPAPSLPSSAPPSPTSLALAPSSPLLVPSAAAAAALAALRRGCAKRACRAAGRCESL